MSAQNLSDTSTWLPLDGLAPGFDENKATLTQDLDGYSFVSVRSDGREVDHHFSVLYDQDSSMHFQYIPNLDLRTSYHDLLFLHRMNTILDQFWLLVYVMRNV